MNNLELQALRHLLFFSVPEAALLLASSDDRPTGVQERSWRRWEDGTNPVPDNIAQQILRLCEWRAKALEAMHFAISNAKRIARGDPEPKLTVNINDFMRPENQTRYRPGPPFGTPGHIADPTPEIVMVWYGSLDDWMTLSGREAVMWRPQCSVVAEAVAMGTRLVKFDTDSYAQWLGKRKDCESLRGAWAAEED